MFYEDNQTVESSSIETNQENTSELTDTDINSEGVNQEETSTKKKRSKKKKDKKSKETTSRKTIIISVTVALLCGAGGAFGGMFFYTLTNHVEEFVNVSTNTSTVTIQEKVPRIENSLSKGSILTDFSARAYDILAYACYKQFSSPYALTIGRSVASSSMSTTTVSSATLSTPSTVFNQNISDTQAAMGISVKTAYRFYDKKDGKIESYEKQVKEDWQASGITPSYYTYDEYIQSYGKLNKGVYYCDNQEVDTSKGIIVSDKYLTDDLDVYNAYSASEHPKKHQVNGVLIYNIQSSTVKASTFKANENGYELIFDLNANKAAAYYRVQMKKTGGLSTLPTFNSSHLEFQLDKDLGLVSSVFKDTYHGKMSIIDVDLSMSLTQYYYRSDTSTFTSYDGSKVQVDVPQVSDINDPITKMTLYKDVEETK